MSKLTHLAIGAQTLEKKQCLASTISSLVSESSRFQEIMEALPMAIYTSDSAGRLTYFNKAAADYAGRTPKIRSDQWCLGWKLYDADGTPIKTDEYPLAVALREARSLSGVEVIAVRPDGKRLWFESYPSPLHDNDGNIIGGINMLIDITENKEVQKLRKRSEHELSDFFENAPIGLYQAAADGTILQANKAELEMLGYNRDEYVGKNIAEFHVNKEKVKEILQKLNAGEKIQDFESQIRCKDGSLRDVVICTNPLKENGKIIHTQCFTRDITKQKQAEKATDKNERKYKKLFDSIDDGLFIGKVIFDEQNNPIDLFYEEVNPAYEKHSILKNVVGKRVSELVPDLNKNWLKKYGEVVTTGQPRRVEEYLDAFERWYSIYAFPIGDLNEHKVAVIFSDITKRKENEHANSLLGAIVDSSDDAIISKKLDGTITSWNSSAERLFGFTAEEAIGKSILMIIPEDRQQEEDMIINRIKNGEGINHFETIRKSKDGNHLNISLTISPILDSSGKVIGVSKIARDITKQKQVQKEREHLLNKIEREQKLLVDVFQKAPSFMCILEGPNHVFTKVNQLYKKIIGNREIVDKPVQEAFPEAEGQGYFELLDQVYTTGKMFRGSGMKVKLQRDPDQDEMDERVVDFVYQPIKNVEGEVTGIFVQGVDLTERSRAKAELQELNKALEQMNDTLEERVEERTAALLSYQKQLRSLASQLSRAEEIERQRLAAELHDNLGQILAVGKMKIDLLDREDNPDKIKSGLTEIKELVNESIRYTRELMTDLKPPPSFQKEDLTASIKWVASRMQKHHLEVIVEDDDKAKPLNEEIQDTIRQCVRELLFNVVKHSGTKQAKINLKREDNELVISVEDNGKGFELNGNIPSPTKEGGFGLFSISERIDHLGGSMDINSKLGKGTIIVLRAPLKDHLKHPALNNYSEVQNNGNNGRDVQNGVREKTTVMLVDDHQMMRLGLKNMINKQDDLIVIEEVADGEKALEIAKETSPDVIVMDVNLPGMNGIEATRKLKKLMPNVRIIGLSLHNSVVVAEQMRSSGAAAYLTKSEAFETLCATIRSEANLATLENKTPSTHEAKNSP